VNRLLIAATGVFVLGAGLGVGALVHHTDAASPRRLTGDITVYAAEAGAGTCERLSGFDDIAAGAPVTVADGSGTVLATAQLQAGNRLGDGSGCRFPFALTDVAAPADVVISVGQHQGLRLSAEQLKELGRNVELRLGGVAAAG